MSRKVRKMSGVVVDSVVKHLWCSGAREYRTKGNINLWQRVVVLNNSLLFDWLMYRVSRRPGTGPAFVQCAFCLVCLAGLLRGQCCSDSLCCAWEPSQDGIVKAVLWGILLWLM